QPNVTVRNGTYAYISTGEEFTFIGEVETRELSNGNQTVTPQLSSVRVGVTLAVTPRILGDGRIMLDIWPVISSVSGLKEYTITDTFRFEVPDVALNELSTEVITESGKPIQLGGFIRRSIEANLQDLPWKDRVTQTTINPIFRSENNKLDRRELVLTVTPTIVEGV
ncbi:MAG: type II and III secretion system protein, partial [Pseudomonadales bacterium]|nr:type II and III secretion system protein [Pseudomonadales bacterium]